MGKGMIFTNAVTLGSMLSIVISQKLPLYVGILIMVHTFLSCKYMSELGGK